MRTYLFLIVVLYIWGHEIVKSQQINDKNIYVEYDELLGSRKFSEDNTDARYLNNEIEKKILVAWEVFKVTVKNANTKAKKWIQQEKEKLNKLNEIVEENLGKLKNEFEDKITKIVLTSDKVQGCLKDNKNNFAKIFSAIISNMNICLSNNVANISNIEVLEDLHDLDDSAFSDNVQNKLIKICKENNEKCLDNVQNEIIAEIEDATQVISNKHFETKDAINDRVERAVICITKSFTTATKDIVDEYVQIVECVRNKDK